MESREELKIKARKLRREGKGLTYIEKEIGIPRGTVSYWCKDIKLTDQQQKVLHDNKRQVRTAETTRAERRKDEKNLIKNIQLKEEIQEQKEMLG